MRLDDRLAAQQKKKKGAANIPEEEETLTYRTYSRETALNREQGVFQNQTFEGINTRKSIFDRTAVFSREPGQ